MSSTCRTRCHKRKTLSIHVTLKYCIASMWAGNFWFSSLLNKNTSLVVTFSSSWNRNVWEKSGPFVVWLSEKTFCRFSQRTCCKQTPDIQWLSKVLAQSVSVKQENSRSGHYDELFFWAWSESTQLTRGTTCRPASHLSLVPNSSFCKMPSLLEWHFQWCH